ncbi:DUF4178 domain-containing protein [Haliangium sp.]|uniref:DUF4178 domain-containing protein n=1 Tax=Haliangium sp. TaxID=2663208 RepID=UPI003D0F9C6F
MSASAPCPRCGAPISFHVSSSLVTVCEHCQTAVARTDRALADLGKCAELHQTQSSLSLWQGGRYQGVGFQITGRVQLQHGAGGLWDEWYLAFDNGHWGWLAEAQGRFYLTFRHPEVGDVVGDPSLLRPGQQIAVGAQRKPMVVAELGEAVLLGGRGEIPYYFRPGFRYRFADLSGTGGEFGTLDYGADAPVLYLGRQVSLAELGLEPTGAPDDAGAMMGLGATPGVKVEAVTCSNCGGALELQAPDRTERVACPYCGAIHDCDHGVLALIQAAQEHKAAPLIPLGSKGQFEDRTFTLIGFMERSVNNTYGRFAWGEYLLYEPELGFRWLVENDGHWSYVKPVPPGEVVTSSNMGSVLVSGDTATYDGKKFKLFQADRARVDYVVGEFYWKVAAGDTVNTADFVHPPEMLSCEISPAELHWSVGTYMTQSEVDARFPDYTPAEQFVVGVAPNQPFRHRAAYLIWFGMLALAIGAIYMASSSRSNKQVFHQAIDIAPKADAAAAAKPEIFFSQPFQLSGGENLRIDAHGSADNSWIYAECDLYNQDTGLVMAFDLPMEYYHGYTAGESWAEGSNRVTRYLSAVPAGTYILRLAVERSSWKKPDRIGLFITEGVLRARAWLLLLLGISIIPIVVAIKHLRFERRRWSESDYATGFVAGGGGD